MKRTASRLLAGTVLACFAFSLSAQVEKVDFSQPLLAVNGKPITDPETKKPMTLMDAAIDALEGVTPDDAREPGLEKFKRDELARKIFGQKEVALDLDDRTLIRDRIGKVFAPNVVGAAWRILDPTLGKSGSASGKN